MFFAIRLRELIAHLLRFRDQVEGAQVAHLLQCSDQADNMNDVMYLKYHTLLYRSASLIEGATEMAHLYINNNVIWNQGAQMIYKTHYKCIFK